MLELYRAIIPANKVINDNHGQHYRIHQTNLEWLTWQFKSIIDGFYEKTEGRGKEAKKVKEEYETIGQFHIPEIEDVHEYIKNKELSNEKFISIRCEVWKPRNIRFDPQNYAKTFKAPIDLLVSNGYILDDSWKYVDGITYCGGGPEVWERAIRYEGDGLPEELTPMWWKENCSESYNDILVRILIK